MIFVDTGAWFANVVAGDARHLAASTWFSANNTLLVTSDYVIAETLTLLRARGQASLAISFGETLVSTELASIEYVSEQDFEQAWQIFRDYDDKAWSFTDCTSKVVMERLGIKTAFAFDQHFRQFGSVDVVP
jgi:predicted nucleic acid-binding protein